MVSNYLTACGDTLRFIEVGPARQDRSRKTCEDRPRGVIEEAKIAKTFSLAQAAEAYRYFESKAQVGKVVIAV
jgi:hypothetical protein